MLHTLRMPQETSPRLSVELVPKLAWGRNVRAVVATETWDALRWHFGAIRFRPQFLNTSLIHGKRNIACKCAVCDVETTALQLHEEWNYDDDSQVQRLVGLKPVCEQCHLVKHLGYANIIGRADEALTHLASINGWTASEAKAYSDYAYAVWQTRSNLTYALDLSYLTRYLSPSRIHLDWLDNPRTSLGSRLDAIVWANRLLESDALILDTETTGLLSDTNVEVIELAAINMKGEIVYQSLFKPRYPIPRKAVEIHRIENEDVEAAPTFGQEGEQIASALHGKTLVSFKTKFDRGVLERTCKLHKVEMPSARWECAMHAYRAFSESGPFLPLPGKSHRALADCKAVLKLIRRIARSSPLRRRV